MYGRKIPLKDFIYIFKSLIAASLLFLMKTWSETHLKSVLIYVVVRV